jgi:integrase
MATVRSPWFRASKNSWYVQYQGKQVRLAVGRESRDDALKAFYKLMAADEIIPPSSDIRVNQVCDYFLDWSQQHHRPETFDHNKYFLQSFCSFRGNGELPASQIKPIHMTRWVDSKPKWKSARRHSQQTVKQAFSWAKQQGLIESNSFADVKLPPKRSRELLLTAEQISGIFAAVKDVEFRNYLVALQESGARPSEVARVKTEDFDPSLGIWVLNQHKTSAKTGKPRVIYLSPRLLELSRTMSEQRPDGLLFPNRTGKPFSRNAIRCRFRRLREKLPHLGYICAYLFRHSFATTALENGVGVAQVAELLGHKSTEMVMRHYGHLNQRVEHMRKMAAQAMNGITIVLNGQSVSGT